MRRRLALGCAGLLCLTATTGCFIWSRKEVKEVPSTTVERRSSTVETVPSTDTEVRTKTTVEHGY